MVRIGSNTSRDLSASRASALKAFAALALNKTYSTSASDSIGYLTTRLEMAGSMVISVDFISFTTPTFHRVALATSRRWYRRVRQTLTQP